MIGCRAPLVAMSVMMLSGVALAQGVPVAQVQAIPSAPNQAAQPAEQAAPAPAPAVDETALRYFARQGDQRRVDAEIARLRTLYPDWEPPENLLT